MTTPGELIDSWLAQRLDSQQQEWLQGLLGQARAGTLAAVALGFSQLPRRLGNGALGLSAGERMQAGTARRGWQPDCSTVSEIGRARLVVALGGLEFTKYRAALLGLFEDADWAEQVALYKALAIAPHPSSLAAQAAEGIRSNIKSVFEAVALDNPYAADYLSEPQFNQLVLKCLFVESPLHRVHALDVRLNPTLATMLCDYARERWAAGRKVSPELWRAVGPVASTEQIELMRRPLLEGEAPERVAAAWSLLDNKLAEPLIQEHAAWIRRIVDAGLSWTQVLAWDGPLE
ncbi:MAG TPA: EboA domain-containing protein [Polyangiaceae bacterium]|nr:EboA domain-containing protein [Polyangiaceae bacterium]